MTKAGKNKSVRFAAVQLMQSLENNSGSLTTLLPVAELQVAAADRALLRELCFGTARWSVRLSALAAQLIDKPLRRKDRDVHWLITLGLYQLEYMRIAEHAALDTTVAVAGELRKSWARGLVNGVLRRFLRQRETLVSQLDQDARLAFPEWLSRQIKRDWPEHWQQHLEGSNERPPMVLRINQNRYTTARYRERLASGGLNADVSAISANALVLEQPLAVSQLPDFETGAVSVQDASAQWATLLLSPSGRERVLDACAAPGGKTGHLLEYAGESSVVAVDVSEQRLQRVHENLQRLSLYTRAQVVAADLTDLDSWWDGVPFDAVLLDAPCSGTGVIRRNPDIKLLRHPEDIAPLVELQQDMLQRVWAVLRPGGRLLYATCSVLKAENQEQVQRFLEAHADARLVQPTPIPHAFDTGFGQQLLRGSHDGDGFFYALLERLDAAS
ncbi:MAG: 16S rRNA (cytosine(967)-C(5))-methyltransferase RsmB [Gammaproteobacteria bacterium]|nr:16S rRNA (cytosine(967)-C(5))-methyltransferase RsmB [Gammaproteobacteria bacterium]